MQLVLCFAIVSFQKYSQDIWAGIDKTNVKQYEYIFIHFVLFGGEKP